MNETQRDIQVFYKKIVESELGFIAEVDKDGDIFFNLPDAGQFYILLEKNDPSHFLSYGGIQCHFAKGIRPVPYGTS
ncbi:hypothetical protein GL297_04520 [Komagataeibacter sp. FXV2]|nr:hypothetical protein [Komagataeibacter sp. FXV2]